MPTEPEDGEPRTLAPDDAFAVLGNETRIQILEGLARAADPLSFSELHDRVDMRDSGQFNYHLDKLLGHFVEGTDDGYDLRTAGERVVEAILSGAVTEDPVLERTPIDAPCHLCGAPREISFRQERVATYCTECPGVYPDEHSPESEEIPDEFGFLGFLHLPPAGVQDRSAEEVHRAARIWNISQRLPAATGVCPKCSGRLETTINVCENHAEGPGLCPECGNRYTFGSYLECTNCIFSQAGVFSLALLGTTELLDFLTDHGINPIQPTDERFNAVLMDYEEEVHSLDPPEATFTFSVDDDSMTLTVEDAGEIADVVPRRELRED
jgi:hypothetical protein